MRVYLPRMSFFLCPHFIFALADLFLQIAGQGGEQVCVLAVDAESLTTAVEDGSQLMEQILGVLEKLSGTTSENDKLFEFNPQALPAFTLPSMPQSRP